MLERKHRNDQFRRISIDSHHRDDNWNKCMYHQSICAGSRALQTKCLWSCCRSEVVKPYSDTDPVSIPAKSQSCEYVNDLFYGKSVKDMEIPLLSCLQCNQPQLCVLSVSKTEASKIFVVLFLIIFRLYAALQHAQCLCLPASPLGYVKIKHG